MLSRVADSLYWMSRYLERAEHTARLMRVRLDTMTEDSEEAAEHSWLRLLGALRVRPTAAGPVNPMELTRFLAFDRANRSCVAAAVMAARDNARQVREQISSEMWEHINLFHLNLMGTGFSTVWAGTPSAFFRSLVEGLTMFQGMTATTMRHGEGYQFIQLGRFIERAQLVTRLLDMHFGKMPADAPAGISAPRYFDWISLLKQCTAFEAYCKVYTARIDPPRIAEFLIFDSEFPHSLRFSIDRVQEAMIVIGAGAPRLRRAASERLAGRLKARLEFGQIDELLSGNIDRFLHEVQEACSEIHHAVHDAFIAYGVEDAVPA